MTERELRDENQRLKASNTLLKHQAEKDKRQIREQAEVINDLHGQLIEAKQGG